MKVRNVSLLDKNFLEAFSSLIIMEMPVRQCMEISNSIDDITAQEKSFNRVRKTLADKYCKKDEKGNPIIDEKGDLTFETAEAEEACIKGMEELLNETFEISLNSKIKVKSDTKMTPIKVRLLKDFIEIID